MKRFLHPLVKQGSQCRFFHNLTRKVFPVITSRYNFNQHSRTPFLYQFNNSENSFPLTEKQRQHRFLLSTRIMAENRFSADYDKRGQASCKKCKQKIGKGGMRIAKVVTNPFTEDGGDMKQYFHGKCIFETFVKARATTKIIEDTTDIEGFAELEQEDKDTVKELIKDLMEKKAKKGTPKKKTPKKAAANPVQSPPIFSPGTKGKENDQKSLATLSAANGKSDENPTDQDAGSSAVSDSKDNAFRQFRRLCADIAEESSYLEKTKIISTFLKKGTSGNGFEGDVYLLLKLLLPGVVKVVYNLNSKQLVKIFSQVFGTSLSEMVEDLENGDVAETVRVFFEKSDVCEPQTKSLLTMQQVDTMLTELSKYTKEDDQQRVLTKLAKRCTANDLKMVVRLIKHDLRINSGAKHVLDGLDPNAYEAFQASRNLRDVVDRVMELRKESGGKPGMSKSLSVRASLMTPVLPMLAEACKSVEMAFKKCPNGMYSEIKYDGERVQLHKQGEEFRYFSRSLKPVLPHKVSHFKEWIPKAFPGGSDLILDCEVLLIDTNTSTPLPFGTLGKHKKEQFKEANVCLFIFDCLNYNGKSLMDKPIKERRKFLFENMKEIPNRILFSEMKHVTKPGDLKDMMADVFNQGLEGLVLKDVNGLYEPGKRHWLKVKKDYLAEGAMADSADLIVLGAYFGTGNKGGLMSIFLMGCYDEHCDKFVTVTKCGSGFDDQTLDKLQKQFHPQMVKVSKDFSKVPDWLKINRGVMPDFLIKDPKVSSVWEISGAEFSKAEIHTAAGISIRFPRCTKMRDDKSWKEATSLARLKELVKTSKEKSDFDELLGANKKKGKASPSKKAANSESEVQMEVTDGDMTDETPKTSPVKTPSKRKSESDLSAGESKRIKQEDSKPVCKYGATCYQKNPEHLEKYAHSSTSSPTKGLPDFFKGMKFHVGDIPNAKKLRRYIIAYDGDVVPDYDQDSALCVVEEKSDNGEREEVTVDWLMACIKKKSLVPR